MLGGFSALVDKCSPYLRPNQPSTPSTSRARADPGVELQAILYPLLPVPSLANFGGTERVPSTIASISIGDG